MSQGAQHSSATLLYLSQGDLVRVGGNSTSLYIEAVREALSLHALGKTVQPLKPYLRWGQGHIADRLIAMPAYIGGGDPVAGLKWIGSNQANPRRGLQRASALIILNDPMTNYPMALLEGSLISGMRTAAVTALGVQYLARPGFSHVACIGCGPIARYQLLTLLDHFSSIRVVNLFDSQADAAGRLARELQSRCDGLRVHLASSAEEAVRAGDVIVTCTVADKPYLRFEWLKRGAFLSNVSIMDVEKEVFVKADKVIVDDWDQCNRDKKIIHQLVLEGRFSREQLHAELGDILIGRRTARERDDETIVLNPMGLAIEDIASAFALYHRALDQGIGLRLPLYDTTDRGESDAGVAIGQREQA